MRAMPPRRKVGFTYGSGAEDILWGGGLSWGSAVFSLCSDLPGLVAEEEEGGGGTYGDHP